MMARWLVSRSWQPLLPVLAALLLAGCGAVASRPGSAAPSPSPAVVLTEKDGGTTVQLSTGTQARLQLSNRYRWSDPQVSGGAVTLSPVAHAQDPGYREWAISTKGPGNATIRAAGSPVCSPGTACPMLVLAFSIKLVIT
jgi:hypothetical protein